MPDLRADTSAIQVEGRQIEEKTPRELIGHRAEEVGGPLVGAQHAPGGVANQQGGGRELEDAFKVVLEQAVLLDLPSQVGEEQRVLERERSLCSESTDQPPLAMPERQLAAPTAAVDDSDHPTVALEREAVPQPGRTQRSLLGAREATCHASGGQRGPGFGGVGRVEAIALREKRDDVVDRERVAKEFRSRASNSSGSRWVTASSANV